MPRVALSLALLLTLPACMSACPSDADEAAKERIFSAEEPPRAEQAAEDALDPAAIPADAELRRRVLRMPVSEMRYRLGSFEAKTRTSFEWSRDGKTVDLSETAVLVQAADGDYRMQVDNDEDFGLELRRVDGTSYVKNRHGAFAERRSDRAEHEAWRQEALAQLETLFDLVDARVALTDAGRTTHAGRPARRFSVSLAQTPDPAAAPAPAPVGARAPVYPEGGPDTSLRHRMAVWELGRPERLQGDLVVDEATGVVVGADLSLRLSVPAQDEGAEPAVLDLSIKRDVSRIGEALTVEVPADHRPLKDRPRAVKDPLAWWPKASADAPSEAAAGGSDAADGAPSTNGTGSHAAE